MQRELTTVRAVCPHDCPDTCGMLVTVEGGKAVTLRGDPDHPFTRGFLCQKVARYLDRVYHPQRLQWPMKRTGPKGAGQFTRISWDEALDTIARELERIAREHGSESILPYSYAGTMGLLNGSGIAKPSALAVVILMMRSNLVGCSTGSSPGFAPRRILST